MYAVSVALYEQRQRERANPDYVSSPSLSFDSQSGTQVDTPDSQRAQTVTFQDADINYNMSAYPASDDTRRNLDSDFATLENFFSRPVKISTEQWDINADFNYTVNPWKAFFEDPRVSNRINNYNLLRATLKIKITINGNGFYYGRILAAYAPIQSESSGPEVDWFISNDPVTSADIVGLSQLPHIYVDPTHSMGGELTCPFFWWYDYLHIVDADWDGMGDLILRSMNPLRHANGDTNPVDVSIFVWAEDVKLAVPTLIDNGGLTPQSGVEPTSIINEKTPGVRREMAGDDEVEEVNRTGMISKPATAVAKVAGVLSRLPILKPYALATELAASTMANMASAFGFSRPVISSGPDPYRPSLTGSLALCNAPDLSNKLTVDDKQELTIDPHISGIGEPDALSIKNIACRESYLTTFQWTAATPSNNMIFNCRVDPVIWRADLSTGAHHFPACAMAALPFKYWSGSMRYRFQIVCSNFHKGRLAFVFEPNYWTSAALDRYNTNYMQIIDISNTQDFTIEVPNGQMHTLLPHPRPGINTQAQMFGIPPYIAPLEDLRVNTSNGVLGVFVLNNLTSPSDAGTTVGINVFVSAGDDFGVHVPDDWFQQFNPHFDSQSGVEATHHNSVDYNAPKNGDILVLGPKGKVSPETNLVFAGETISSFRQLLKRYSRWRSLCLGSDTGKHFRYRQKFSWFPAYRGRPYQGNIPDATAAATGYAYNTTTLLHWVSLAFRGMRGSTRFKFVPYVVSNGDTNISGTMERYSNDDGFEFFDRVITQQTSLTTQSEAAWFGMRNTVDGHNDDRLMQTANGAAVFHSAVNPTCEVEIPYYCNRRFVSGRHTNWMDWDTYQVGGFYLNLHGFMSFQTYANLFQSVGEDFQVYFFMGLPKMYYEPIPPLPAT